MRSISPDRRAHAVLGCLFVAVTIVAGVTPAGAGNDKSAQRREPLTAVGRGHWHPDLHGGAHAEHEVSIRWPDATTEVVPGTVTVDAVDGSFPVGYDECEAAVATIDYDRYRTADLEMVAEGTVCNRKTYDGESSFLSFTGRYLMEEGPKRYLDSDGWVEMSLSADHGAYVLTTDT